MVCENSQNISISILFSYFFVCLSLISYILMVFNNILKNVSKIKVIKYHDDSAVDDSINDDDQDEEQEETKETTNKEDEKEEADENTITNTINEVLNTNIQNLKKENDFFIKNFKFPVNPQNEMTEIEKLFKSLGEQQENNIPVNKKNKIDKAI